MCVAVQEHIEEYSLGPEDLLFPQWMFAYVRSSPVLVTDTEDLPPLVSKSGAVYELTWLADQCRGVGAIPGERRRKAVSRSLGPAVAARLTGAANSGWRPVRGTSTGAIVSRPVARARGIGRGGPHAPG